ncbi:ketopantoate reductase PanE/ApbA-domain-containing protein, partial [Lipomyces oligophaga]|uniref:ketopantoate reductase PanE/ApbA-domain-containing protein n=1 Tax=Lipomyces oligophaga TaxID=45792 RepID=UPI0034CFF541
MLLLKKPESPPIYVLGVGSIGTYVAHGLLKSNETQNVVLIMRESKKVFNFKANGSKLGVSRQRHSIFPGEPVIETDYAHGFEACTGKDMLRTMEDIQFLIVCTKAHQTMEALNQILERIGPETTILFLQNGMGLISKLLRKFWPIPSLRPTILCGINTHGITRQAEKGEFQVQLRGPGTIQIAEIPRLDLSVERFSELYIFIRLLENSSSLAVSHVGLDEFTIAQVKKMVANCCINPITAILGEFNGSMSSPTIQPTVKNIIGEVVKVLNCLPEVASRLSRFQKLELLDEDALQMSVMNLADKTASNQSSMFADIELGRETEISFLNHYICEIGKKYSIDTPVNKLITNIV